MMLTLTVLLIIPYLGTSPTFAAEDGQLGKGQYEIICEGNTVSVRANDANVVQLLIEFSQKSGISFNKYVGKTQTVTLDLSGAPIEEFLNRVIGSHVSTSKKKNGSTHISSVTIMDEGSGNSPPRNEPPPPPEPAASDQEPKDEADPQPHEENEGPWRRDRQRIPARNPMPHNTQPPDSPPPQPNEESGHEHSPPTEEQSPEP